jgi:hypothetical protein
MVFQMNTYEVAFFESDNGRRAVGKIIKKGVFIFHLMSRMKTPMFLLDIAFEERGTQDEIINVIEVKA